MVVMLELRGTVLVIILLSKHYNFFLFFPDDARNKTFLIYAANYRC